MATRSSTEKFLVGQNCLSIQDNELPTGRNVLQYLNHKKFQESQKTKLKPKREDLLGCPTDSSNNARCSENESCLHEPCVLRAVKMPWAKAGFPTIGDKPIRSVIETNKQTYKRAGQSTC